MNRSIDLRQLRYFVAVAEELNFRRAAERLHITQPPLSRQVAELEAALGVPLLERTTKSVQLTPAGQAALQEFRALLAAFDAAMERVAQTQAAPKRRLRLGMVYWSDLAGLAAFEEALLATRLATGVDVISLATHESMAALKRGELDAALVTGPLDTEGLAHRTVGRERHAAFVPQSHPLASQASHLAARPEAAAGLLPLPPRGQPAAVRPLRAGSTRRSASATRTRRPRSARWACSRRSRPGAAEPSCRARSRPGPTPG